MRCNCGHSLKTVMELDGGQCARCSDKVSPRETLTDWEAAGSAAWHNGLDRVPLIDSGVMRAIRNGGSVLHICSMWLKGWDSENLAAPI